MHVIRLYEETDETRVDMVETVNFCIIHTSHKHQVPRLIPYLYQLIRYLYAHPKRTTEYRSLNSPAYEGLLLGRPRPVTPEAIR